MLFKGKSITLSLHEDGIAEFIFDTPGSVNKFDQSTFQDFRDALTALENCEQSKGLLIRSVKPAFIVGADINEFLGIFSLPDNEFLQWIKDATDTFDRLEDLNMPTVVAINGFALGGGCEFILSCDYRIADDTALIGLPEVKLGIMPGFGGTVRLPRLIGADNAAEWMSTGKSYKAEQALAVNAIDAVVAAENLIEAAKKTLQQAINGKLDWRAKRQPKLEPLSLSPIESLMSFSTAKGMILAKAGKHYPSPVMMINTVEQAAALDRIGAMALENENFVKLAKTSEATAQVGLFLADQVIKGKAKKASKQLADTELKIEKASVLGAGIMGGGIAYQSAYKNVPIVMKDIHDDALELGLTTASGILAKLHQRNRITTEKMAKVLNNITPSLSYDAISGSDIVVEAVVENSQIKQSVLAEVEARVDVNTILASNTSTISIDVLAEKLTRKDKFCGMHFFNPVHRMPLVEVIRGKDTSDETVAAVVAYAAKMGKSPIVVNNCPGFYVNRVLFPYLAAFSQLVISGVDFVAIDKVMEKEFGWPMGPAMLLDVVGIDTADHCTDVMAAGFPTRMAKIDNDPVSLLYQNSRYGQKQGGGFYDHSKDNKGKTIKSASETAYSLLYQDAKANTELSANDIINRLMVPMVNEVVRCLEEGIVDTAFEADMGLIYGLGFPPFRGGAIRYLETMGIENFIAIADSLAADSRGNHELYQVTQGMRDMAASGKSYFETDVKLDKKSNKKLNA